MTPRKDLPTKNSKRINYQQTNTDKTTQITCWNNLKQSLLMPDKKNPVH